MEASKDVEACFRKKGSSARALFWKDMEKPFTAAFGFPGEEFAKRKQGLLFWSDDRFDQSRAIFKYLLKEAQDKNYKDIEADTLFTLARIEENNGKLEASLDYYRQFSEKYQNNEKYIDVLMASVLLNSVLGNINAGIANINSILTSQTKLAIDERSTSGLSFALFWGGRLHFSNGNKTLAEEMWRRVATEYYSTFYGALGHYVLEKISGKPLRLEPSTTSPFSMEKLYASLDDSGRTTAKRIEALLKIGLKDDASCEIAEFKTEPEQREKVLMKALFQNASGDWLSSIKNFDGLARSFRHGLPIGFEKLLFPRAYEKSVLDYSKRLELDPDLVFAIIRQESVFNPRARSPAGASGLMQLMPQTARVEARRLGLSYLGQEDRNKVARTMQRRSALFDAETNVVIGVHHLHGLLKQYGNVIHVLTSYNANPKATRRWIEKIPSDDFLVFIERIPYQETRMYVKLVLRNYFYYKRWYKPSIEKMPHLDMLASAAMTTVKPKDVPK
jgi:tetratricopeptide (TPR) repeat protein